MAEINKKDRGGASGGGGPGEAEVKGGGGNRGSFDLLDTRCYMKLVDVAHTLLKMAPYDLGCIKAKGKSTENHIRLQIFLMNKSTWINNFNI